MTIITKRDYDTTIKINDRHVKCYSKKKLKNLHPDGNYKIVGETFEKNKKRRKDILDIANMKLNVSKFGKNNRILYKRKGYVEVGDNQYIALLKSRIPFLLIMFCILLAIGISTYSAIKIYTSIPSVEPEYLMPLEDEKVTPIEEDNTKKSESQNGGGSVRIRLSNTVNIDLKTGDIEMIYQNPNQSNQDSVVTLVLISDNKEYVIAKSGLVKSGKQITQLKLNNSDIKLSEGVYEGKYIIEHYNPTTGEKAMTNSNFNDIRIQVK